VRGSESKPRSAVSEIYVALEVARELGWGGMDWVSLALERDQRRALANTVRILGLHKMLRNC
jgi:hypothetical protein